MTASVASLDAGAPRHRGAWTLTPIFAVLAALATLTNSTGRWIGDARLEYSTAPGRFLAGHAHLWDATRGIGNTATFYTPAIAAYQALFELLGAQPWLIERLLHATYLTIAAAGVAALVGVTTPRVGAVHLLAGLLYAFNPYVSQFLLPSGLFLSYAFAPWFLWCALRGVADDRQGVRHAAIFALCVFVIGALNTASLLYAVAAIPIAFVYLVIVERSVRWRDCIAWVARAGSLTLLVSSGTLVVLWFQRSDISLNLATTEQPAVVASLSSPAESWRGLGLWLTYFQDGLGPLRPQSEAYFRNPLVIVATYAAPMAAGLTLALSRWRSRLLYGTFAVVGVVVMVGLFPPSDPSPLGRLLEFAFDRVVVLRGLRATYKAGAIFMIGIAILAGYGVASLWRTARDDAALSRSRTLATRLAGVFLVLGFVVAAFPFWTGNLYAERDGYDTIPTYWDDAFDWLEAQPDDGRVLVLPGVIRTRYRWGNINDNLFHGLLDRSVVMHQSIPPPGTPLAADLILDVDDELGSGHYTPGTLEPIMRRLGVSYVLIQNDVDWQAVGVPRPFDFDAVRSDADLELVASFGSPGVNTTAPTDRAARLIGEDQLAPVEIFRLGDPLASIRTVAGPDLIVSGAGDSWTQLADQGLLQAGAVRYTGTLDTRELGTALEDGSTIVVTDGNRRRVAVVIGGRLRTSRTVGLDEISDRPLTDIFGGRPASDLFGDPDTQTIAQYGDARSIDANRTGSLFGLPDPSIRAAQAFDGTAITAWKVDGREAAGAALQVALLQPTELASMEIQTVTDLPDRRVDRLTVRTRLGSGSPRVVEAIPDPDRPGWFVALFDESEIDDVEIEIVSIAGPSGGSIGIAEVAMRANGGVDLDLREVLRTPIDLGETAAGDASVAEALTQADIRYSFAPGVGAREDPALRRDFRMYGEHDVTVGGTVRLGADAMDRVRDVLVGSDVGAYGSEAPSEADGWGSRAIDADPGTAWLAAPSEDQSLTLRLPAQAIDRIEFVTSGADNAAGDNPRSTITDASVTVTRLDGTPVNAPIEAVATDVECTDTSEVCTRTFVVELESALYSEARFDVGGVDVVVADFGQRAIAVSDVRLNDGALEWPPVASSLSGCVDAFTLDDVSHAIRLEGSVEDLLSGAPVAFEMCGGPVTLAAGDHRLVTDPLLAGAFGGLQIGPTPDADEPESVNPPSGRSATVTVVEASPTRVELRVSADAGTRLIGPGAFHRGWEATVDGRSIGRAVPLDGQSGWILPQAATDARVELVFRPQRAYEMSLALTAAGVAICLYLARPRRRR